MAEGIVIVNKPTGWTSMDVCAKLRGVFHTKKIGHAGTLDPMATGVLPVFVGQATRAVSFAENGNKEYIATLRLGCVTDTQDTSGEVLESHEVTATMSDLMAVLPRFTGPIEQIPPMYSAIKINGQKLYDLARQGKTVERKARKITIEEIEVLRQISPTDFELRILCSKGTYIRTLCHDIGAALQCGGCMASLQRSMAAGFRLSEAYTLEEIQSLGTSVLASTDSLFREHPAYHITIERQDMLNRNGNAFFIHEDLPGGIYRIYGLDGSFRCISQLDDHQMTSIKNFFGA